MRIYFSPKRAYNWSVFNIIDNESEEVNHGFGEKYRR